MNLRRQKSFTWTDKELSLLLQVIIDYKADKASLGKDWDVITALLSLYTANQNTDTELQTERGNHAKFN